MSSCLPVWSKPSAKNLVRMEGRPPKFPRLVDFLTFLKNIKGEQIILPHFTFPLAKLYQSRVIHMNTRHFLPQLIHIVDCGSKESEAVVESLKVAGDRLDIPIPNVTNAMGKRDQGLHKQAISEGKPGVH